MINPITDSIITSTNAVVNAQDVITYDVASNLFVYNSGIIGNSTNTSLTGIRCTNASTNLFISNNQFNIFGSGGKVFQLAGGNFISNANNPMGSATFGNNISVAGFTLQINQTRI
jgi:hypothetical protein